MEKDVDIFHSREREKERERERSTFFLVMYSSYVCVLKDNAVQFSNK